MTESIRNVPVCWGPLDSEPRGIARQSTDENCALLYRVLADAGVDLGRHDRLVVDWLGGWGAHTALTVASLIARAADTNGQGDPYRTLADAVTSTMAYPGDREGDAPEHVCLAEYFGRTE